MTNTATTTHQERIQQLEDLLVQIQSTVPDDKNELACAVEALERQCEAWRLRSGSPHEADDKELANRLRQAVDALAIYYMQTYKWYFMSTRWFFDFALNGALEPRPTRPSEALLAAFKDWAQPDQPFTMAQLLYLLVQHRFAPTPLRYEKSDTVPDCQEDVIKSFSRPYFADTHKEFDSLVADFHSRKYDKTKYFGRCIPIIQSHGQGKSRMVYELGKIQPLFSITLRPGTLDPLQGFPLSDFRVEEYLRGEVVGAVPIKFAVLAALIGSIFDHLAKSLPDTDAEEGGAAAAAASGGGDARSFDFFPSWDVLSGERQANFSQVCHYAESMLQLCAGQGFPSLKEVFEMLTVDAARKLARRLKHLEWPDKPKGKPRFYFAWDQCENLNKVNAAKADLCALRHVISKFKDYEDELECEFWFLFVSTDLSIVS
ncbi:hypothetical protein ACQY0O_003442 [Thecaphora frezii]